MEAMYTYLYKQTTSEGWLDISCLVNSSKTTIVNGICSRDFKSTTNTASFEVIPVNAYMGIYEQLLEDILTAQSDMSVKLEAKILIDEVIVASGYIDLASVSIQSTKVAGRIKISIRDYIIDLDQKCKANLVREEIALPLIVEELLEMAGIKATLYASAWDGKVHHFVVTEDDDNTFRDIIDTLLFELGNRVLYRNPSDGSYNIIPILSTETPKTIVNYLVNKTLSTTSKIWDHDGVLVKYPTVVSKDNMSMYIDEASTDDKGKVVPSKDFYPTDGDVTATFQDYRKDILDYDYNSKISRRQNGDLDLLYVKNAHVEISPKDTFTFPLIPDVELDVNPKYYPRKAQCLLMNNTAKEATLKQFDIIGTAVYRDAINNYTIPENPTQPKEYEASYIETEAEAKTFATGYLNLCKYGSTIATWTTTADMDTYAVGKPVIVRHKAGNSLSQGFTVISMEIAQDKGIVTRKYVAIANSKYNEYKGVASKSKPTGSTSKIIAKDIQQFYLSTDEETPTGGEWLEKTTPNPPKDKYLFTRRYVRYIDGTEYIGSYYRVGVGEDGRPAMTLQLSRLTYHYDSKGNLKPSAQMVTATVTGIPNYSPIHWKINGELLQTQETTIEIPPSYMKYRDYIDIEVSLDAIRITGTVVRVMDGADYIPVVQYRYSTSKNDPDADSAMIAYGVNPVVPVVYGNYGITYGMPWTDTVPVGDQYKDMYLWKRTWSYKLNIWLYERVNDIALVFEIYPSSYTYPMSKRATDDIEIVFTPKLQGITGTVSWSTTVGTFVGSTLFLPAGIESKSVTVKATCGGLERSITLEGIRKGDDEPVYSGIRTTPPESTKGKQLVDGDYYMSTEGIPMRYNGDTKTWEALEVNDRNHAEILKKCGEDWIADGRKVEKTMAAVYGYFHQLYSDSVVAESIDTDALKANSIKADKIDLTDLMAKKLQLKTGGVIYGGGCTIDAQGNPVINENEDGFYIASDGSSNLNGVIANHLLVGAESEFKGSISNDLFSVSLKDSDAMTITASTSDMIMAGCRANEFSLLLQKVYPTPNTIYTCHVKYKGYDFVGVTWTEKDIRFYNSNVEMRIPNNASFYSDEFFIYDDDKTTPIPPLTLGRLSCLRLNGQPMNSTKLYELTELATLLTDNGEISGIKYIKAKGSDIKLYGSDVNIYNTIPLFTTISFSANTIGSKKGIKIKSLMEPNSDNIIELGSLVNRFKKIMAYEGDFLSSVSTDTISAKTIIVDDSIRSLNVIQGNTIWAEEINIKEKAFYQKGYVYPNGDKEKIGSIFLPGNIVLEWGCYYNAAGGDGYRNIRFHRTFAAYPAVTITINYARETAQGFNYVKSLTYKSVDIYTFKGCETYWIAVGPYKL